MNHGLFVIVGSVFKVGFCFVFADKEGKGVHLSYQQKCMLVAYTQQVTHGKFNPELHGSVGVLDVVGKDRKLAWQKLGDISREGAMRGMVETLNGYCPLFHAYVKAQVQEIEMKAHRERVQAENRVKEEEQRKLQEEEDLKNLAEMEEQEEKRRQIKEALNVQTFDQFKVYAEQQFPDNPDQQAILIRQLQEQHYIQYMQQIYQQQISTQNSPSTGQVQHELSRDVEAAALEALGDVQNFSVEQDRYSESGNENEGKFCLFPIFHCIDR